MEYYEPRSRKWAVLSEMDCWRSCTAVAAHDSTLYLLGGEETDCKSPTGSRTVNRVTKFDAEKQVWPLTQFYFMFPFCTKSLVGERLFSSVPPSNSLVSVSDPSRAF